MVPGGVSRRPQAVALTMAPKDKDPLLRFYDTCPAYARREAWLESWLVCVGCWVVVAAATRQREES